jgi:CheY-like chemotaxis protein
MPNILVVDDDPVYRDLTCALLGKLDGLTVLCANNGREAAELLRTEKPDAVVTDLCMPEMDGLQLVEHIRREHCGLPVILMTAFGSEEIAAQAIQKGAASYVPKTNLARNLGRTVSEVLAVAASAKAHQQLRHSMTHNAASFCLENDLAMICPLVRYLQEAIAWMELRDENGRVQVGIAIQEALANAMLHGNLELDSAMREEDAAAYDALARQRRSEAPYSSRFVHVDTTLSREQATIVIRDDGTSFDISTVPDPTQPENLSRIGGRGLFLIRSFIDRVRHNDGGNQIALTILRHE